MEDWYRIKTYLPDLNGNGGCVIVATQLRQIARLCIGQHQNVQEQEVGQLSAADDRVYAFFAEIRIPSEPVSIIILIYLTLKENFTFLSGAISASFLFACLYTLLLVILPNGRIKAARASLPYLLRSITAGIT
jgi:hypothetical protein